MKKRNLAYAPIILASALFVAPFTAAGQTTKMAEAPQDDDRQVLRALLDEMRQLRVALQRTQVVSQRIQVTLERTRIQQAHVDTLTRSLEGVRTRLTEIRSARPQIDEQIKEGEELLNRTTDPNRRGEIETQIKELKSRVVVLAREDDQTRDRESELNTQLQAAQARLSDLDMQLTNIVRELEAH